MPDIESTSDVGEAVFAGDGEMRARCRAMNWAATPLGPVEEWSEVLRTTVRTILESPFAINLWCGPELVLIYNDAYRRVLGRKHPGGLGRPGAEISRDLAVGMGGTLTAESTPGVGSTFTLARPRG